MTMPIGVMEQYAGDGFVLLTDPRGEQTAMVSITHASPELDHVVRSRGITRFRIERTFDANRGGLSFLLDIGPQVQSLGINGAPVRDLGALEKLPNLEDLSVGEELVDLVNFAALVQLRACTLGAGKGIGTLAAAPVLERVKLFDSVIQDLSVLAPLRGLRHLSLNQPKRLSSLDGIETFHLESFDLGSARRMVSVAPVAGIQTLRSLYLDGVRSIADIEVIGRLQSLQKLRLDGGPELESFAFLQNCSHLEEFGIWNTSIRADPASVEAFTRMPKLRVLKLLSGARSVSDMERVGDIASLEVLMIKNGPQLRSLHFLRELPKLTELLVSRTPISDGNLEPLLELPSLNVVHEISPWKKHYSHTLQQINEVLATRERGRPEIA